MLLNSDIGFPDDLDSFTFLMSSSPELFFDIGMSFIVEFLYIAKKRKSQEDTTASNGAEKFMESPNQYDLWKASVNFSAP